MIVNMINKMNYQKRVKKVRNGTLFGTLFAGLGSLLLFTKRRRKENDKNKYLNYCK